MKLLLDTHAFLWWITDDERLSLRARELISQGDNELYLSAASAWEMAIKVRLGRLQFVGDPSRIIPEQMATNDIMPLAVEISHALGVHDLPLHHRDPFDRLLVSQSIRESMPLLSGDPQVMVYQAEVIW